MNKEKKKNQINKKRFEFIKKVAGLSQAEVERCLKRIDQASDQNELNAIEFVAPAWDHNIKS